MATGCGCAQKHKNVEKRRPMRVKAVELTGLYTVKGHDIKSDAWINVSEIMCLCFDAVCVLVSYIWPQQQTKH